MRQELQFFGQGAKTAGMVGAFFGSRFETSAALSNAAAAGPGIISSIRQRDSEPLLFNILGGLITSLLAGYLHLEMDLPKPAAFLIAGLSLTLLALVAEIAASRMENRAPQAAR